MRTNSRLALAASIALIAWGCLSCTSSTSSEAGKAASSGSAASAASAAEAPLRLVVIGDSIPYNASYDCPGCVGFVDQYARALGQTTGREIETTNLSEHNNLTLPMLLKELHATNDEGLPSFESN